MQQANHTQVISIPGTAMHHPQNNPQQLDITFGSDNEESPEHRITAVKYKSALATNNQRSSVELMEGANKEVESMHDGNIKHQLIMSPSTQTIETKLLNVNKAKHSKTPFQKGGNKARIPIEQLALGIPMEESFEDEEIHSLPGDHSDLGKAKQKLLEMEERYNKITFKKMPKKQAQQVREEAVKQKKKQDVLDKYSTKLNFTQHQWNSTKQLNLPNPLLKDQTDETEFNFKVAANKTSAKDRSSNFNNTKLNWTNEQTTDGGEGSKQKLNSQTNTMLKTNQKFYNSRQDKFYNTQTSPLINGEKWTSPVSTAQVCPKAIGLQFSSLEQAKRFRQRSLLEAANKKTENDDKFQDNEGVDDIMRNQTINSIGTSPLNFGTATIPPPGPNSVFKNSRAHFAGTRLNTTSKLADISLLPAPSTQLDKLPPSWAEEQRIKKLVNDYEELEFTGQQNKDQDPLLKLKSQVQFILNKAMKVVQNYCAPDLCQLMERGLGNLLQLNQQKITKYRNDLKFYEIEKQKHLSMIEDRDKLIYQYQIRDLSEEEKQKLSWKDRQERMDKYKKIDKVIDELFTEEAICVQKVEPHYIVNQPLEEQELEQEERMLNFRRMNWLEKDMELMMRLIQMEVSESYRIYGEANFEKHLSVLAETLKEGVDLGIQNQIANFHLRIEEILKENQRLLKSKEPEKIDRCYQTDTWNMERYLDELDSLKRQKWIFEKEIKELKEQNEKNKERIKKLKDDNLRLNKKVANMQEKERTIDSQLHEKDKLMQDIKEEALRRINEAQKKEVDKAKEVKALQEKYDVLNKMKLDREVEMLKREEEQQKKMEQMETKMKEAKAAVNYFNKMLKKKEADLENTKEVFEMQMKIQSMIGSGDNSETEEKTKRGNKKTNKKPMNPTKSLNMKEINESKEHTDESRPASVPTSARNMHTDGQKAQMHKKELSSMTQGPNLSIPKNSAELSKLKSVSPRIQNRRASNFLDENSHSIDKTSNKQNDKQSNPHNNKDSFDAPSIGAGTSKNNETTIKVEGIQRQISPQNILIDNFENSKDDDGSHKKLLQQSADEVQQNNTQDIDISLRVSAEGNKTLDAMDYNFMIGEPKKKTTKKQASLTVEDQESARQKSFPPKGESMLITTEEKSIQVDNPVIIYQQSPSFAQPEKSTRKPNLHINLPPPKPLMFVEETQTTEQIPFDYINMILRYEEEKKKNSIPHVAKGLQRGKLPTAADLASLNTPVTGGLSVGKKTISAANTTNYHSGEFLSHLENQLATNKKNSMGSKMASQSPPESQKGESRNATIGAGGQQQSMNQMMNSKDSRNSMDQNQYSQSHSLPSKPLQSAFNQNEMTLGTAGGSDLVPFQGTNGQIMMIPASAFGGQHPNLQRSHTNDVYSNVSQISSAQNNRLQPIFTQNQMMNNTATFNAHHRLIQQIPSAITEEDLNTRVEEHNQAEAPQPRKNYVLNYSPQRSIVQPSGDNQSPTAADNKKKQNPNWVKATIEMKQEAIESKKKQIQSKINKNIAVALNTLVGKNNRNPAAAMEKMLNMRNVAAMVDQAQVTNPDQIDALKETLEANIAQNPPQPKKILSPPRILGGSQSVQSPQVPPQIQQMRQIVFEGGSQMSSSVGIGNTKQSQLFKHLNITNENQPQFVVSPHQVMGQLYSNDQLPAIKERSGQQSSKFSLRGESHKEPRDSLQNVDLMEYYQKMRPERGFQALLIGRPMSIEEVRLTSGQLVERSRSNSPADKFKIILPDALPDSQDPFFLNADIPLDQQDYNHHHSRHHSNQ